MLARNVGAMLGFQLWSRVDMPTRADLAMFIPTTKGGSVSPIMDPQVTWNSLLEEWANRSWLDVTELAEALLDWLDRDGFPPKTSDAPELGFEWHAAVAKAAAMFALQRAKAVLNDPDGIPARVAFSLTCAHCNVEGPVTFYEAKRKGWTRIQYVPALAAENFLGICFTCSRRQ